MAFRSPIDIAKRTCQQLEQTLISTFTDDTPTANHINEAYDNLRIAELSRHTWAFSIRRARLRAITSTTQIWTPPTWSSVTTYTVGAVVMANAGTYANSAIYPWVLSAPTSLNENPELMSDWSHYFGTLYTDVFDSGATYAASEVVIQPGLYAGGVTYVKNAIVSDTNGLFWVSLAGANTGHTPATSPTWWTPWVLPSSGLQPTIPAIVYQSTGGANPPTIYLSLLNDNGPSTSGVPAALPSTSTGWVLVGGTLQQLTILFPLGTGPQIDNRSANLFPLPATWLRPSIISLDSKIGAHPYLGALYGRDVRDYVYQGNWIVDWGVGPIDYDFVADVADVTLMPAQFCESLAVRIGLEVDGPITQSKNTQKLNQAYARITGEAMRVDAIIQGDPVNEIEELIRVRY